MSRADVISPLRQVWDASTDPRWPSRNEVQLTAAEEISFVRLRELSVGEIFVSLGHPQAQMAFDADQQGVLRKGDAFTLTVPRQMDHVVVVENLGSLLQIPAAQTREPSVYVLLAQPNAGGFFAHIAGADLGQAPQIVRRYHEALRLWSILGSQAEYIDETNGDALFFGTRRTVLSPGFGLEDLGQDIVAQPIEDFVRGGDRADARSEIFVCVLSEFLRDQNSSHAFRTILRGTEVLVRRLREGLAIYVAEHSSEKLAKEAEASALTFSEKLEKVISGLETKSLSIPVALLLGVKDVEPGLGATALNSILAVSALIFAATMSLVHGSQLALLDVVRSMIASSLKEFTSKGLEAQSEVLRTSFASLVTRSTAAKRFSWLMAVASWVPLFSIIGAAYWGTPKAISPAGSVVVAPQVSAPSPAPARTTKGALSSPQKTGTPSLIPASSQPAANLPDRKPSTPTSQKAAKN